MTADQPREDAIAAGPDAREAFIRRIVALTPGNFTDDFLFLLDRLDEARAAMTTPRADAIAPEQDIEVLRAAAWRLCEAVADKAAADGLYASGLTGWKQAMDADDEYMAALRALRTACDGRPRP